MERVRLAEGVRTRRESFGGLVYDPRTGTTIELDRGALRLLELARGGVHLDVAHERIREERLEPDLRREEMIAIAGDLRGLGMIRSCSGVHQTSAPVSAGPWPSIPHLTAPEAVHWAVTYRCEADCSYCYAARHKDTDGELTTSRALAAIDAFAEWGVFQLAIGGGEPLVRNDLDGLIRHAVGRGLSVHVTTGGDHLTPSRMATLAGALTCLQIGVRHHDLLQDPPGTQAQRLRTICDTARDNDLAVGANLILCRTTLRRPEDAVRLLHDAGFRRLTLLRYKPPTALDQWRREAPDAEELHGVEERISRLASSLPDLKIRVDCALSFLFRGLPTEVTRRNGLRGCVAGSRIVALSPDGAIYPCSQLVDPRFRAGHILSDDPRAIWTESEALTRLRDFRRHRHFRRSVCGTCQAANVCGGCRVFTHNATGPDPGCPDAADRSRTLPTGASTDPTQTFQRPRTRRER
ncbi:hypothetical protein CMK11_07210 [Candidatus Poribacteria bacterium]|nr:hypothetical protein [Candidatus Poribacteria bacterium]